MSEAAAPTSAPTPTATSVDVAATGSFNAAQTTSAKATANAQAHTAPPPAKVDAPAKPAEPEYWEVPVDNQKIKMTKEEVLREASLARAANKRFEEGARMRKEAEKFTSRLRDPKSAIDLLFDKELGHNPEEVWRAFEERYKAQIIDREAMTPEQRELADAKARIEAFEKKEAEEAKAREEQENQKMDAATAEAIQKEAVEILETSGLPKTKFTVSRIAHWTKVNEMKGINAPRELIVKQVRGEAEKIIQSMVQSADGDVLVKLLGPDTVKKIRAYDLKMLREKRNKVSPQAEPEQTNQDASSQERITPDEVRKRMRTLWT